MNYNKKSIVLDCSSKDGLEKLQRLLAGADVLIDGLEPAERAAHGLDREYLRQQYPQLVVADVAWFGESGPYSDFRGTDAISRALGGLVKLIGPAEGPPLALPDYQAAIVGGLAAYIPVVASLISRLNGDAGRAFEISIFEAQVNAAELQLSYFTPDTVERRLGINTFSASGGLGIFPCKQGFLGVTSNTSAQWRDLCALMGMPELGTDPEFLFGLDRGSKRQKLQAVFAPIFMQRTAAEWFDEALKLKLPLAIVPSMAELLQTKVFRERGAIVPIQVAKRTVETPGSPFHLVRTPPASGGKVPELGEHTAAILQNIRRTPLKPGHRSSNSRRPLEGIRIIDLSMGWAGPLAARNLADLGADVIKVEACQYPDWWRGIEKAPNAIKDVLYEKSVRFNLMQRGKRGITLDLTSREGVRLLKELIKTSDALLENNSAGVLRKLGLEYERLVEVNPSIVMMSMSAFGSTGAWSELRAYGSTLEQASGLPGLAGLESERPMQTHPAGGDPIGGLNGCCALLSALLHRKRTGQGQFIDLSLVECMLPLAAVRALEQSANGKLAPRMGNRHPHYTPHGVFRCAGEDQWVMLAITDDAMWQSLCQVMARDDLARDPRLVTAAGRRLREPELEAAIDQWTRSQPAAEAMLRLQRAGVAAGVAQTPGDLLSDPHLQARNFWQEIDRPFVGKHLQASVPYRESGAPYPILRAAPTLGQYNEEVLQGLLGLSDAELKTLAADRVIGTQPILPARRQVKVN